MRRKPNRYFVYMMSNPSKTLYTGVTGDLFRRAWQHRVGNGSKFTSLLNLTQLVWFEETDQITVAIAREKQIKNWRRKWKLELVEADNPSWVDLSAEWYEVVSDPESSSG